ncbi:inositol monophosphatase family protein [Chitinivibrio alkaliphilus]|uniref:Inositol-1-monophosphatase n=1 Tax=Chitinivibrio alkaliphilus ACht1 TaxID=1313304 RepID=U7D3X7_9BACT|nr:inositol monophosphatase family protein [Chitinivibrio alkaliphilus]ERP31209.1 inositol monophosphatase [Chitinivibrio alkaliphilus ACht1]
MEEFLTEIIRSAGKIVQDYYGVAHISEKGSAINTVTEADYAAEAYIRTAIAEAYPTHLFLGEESAEQVDLHAEHLWVVDPLDGTNNFSCGMPHYSVSIAYAQNGVVQVGAVYDPSRDELFYAERGKGAFLNGQPMVVSQRTGWSQALICTGFYYDRGEMMRKTLDTVQALFHHNIRGLRRTGSAALDICWTGAGRFDAFFEYELHPWDFAAGLCILREAGGGMADIDGGEMNLKSRGIICGSQNIFNDFFNLVVWQ